MPGSGFSLSIGAVMSLKKHDSTASFDVEARVWEKWTPTVQPAKAMPETVNALALVRDRHVLRLTAFSTSMRGRGRLELP